MNTMQHEFDAVVAHLYKQGKPAMAMYDAGVSAGCAYRGDNCTSCAVGCRIPDSMYDDGMEGEVVGTLINNMGFTLPQEIYAYPKLFASLQQAHDESAVGNDGMFVIERLTENLRYVAGKHKLTFVAPQ